MAVDWRLAGQGFDAGEVLQSFGQAQDRGLLMQQRALQQQELTRRAAEQQRQQAVAQQVGAYAAAGDVQGGRRFALENGAFDLASHFDKLDDANRKRQLEDFGLLGQQALLADTPEKWDRAVQYYVQQGHPEAAGYVGQFGMRDAIIAQAGLAKDYGATRLTQARIEDIDTDNKRQASAEAFDRSQAQARLGLAYASDRRARESRQEGRVRFRERDKDRAALAAGGRGVRTDLSDLDY